MPLPNDEKLIALSEEILKQFEAMFGSHPGFRPGHAGNGRRYGCQGHEFTFGDRSR